MSMDPIPGEVLALLKEVRAYLANANDPWDRRRELIAAINQYAEGGEADLFVGTVREMSRIGASYTTLLQTLAQMNTGADAAAKLSGLMAQTMPTAAFLMPGFANPMAGNAMAGNPFAGAAVNPFANPFVPPPATGNASGNVPPMAPGMDYFRMVSDFLNAQATSRKAAGAASGAAPAAGDATGEAPRS
jgi:hypothetical protein